MFVISELQDLIEIRASCEDKDKAVMNALKFKYTMKLMDDLGMCVFINKIYRIIEFEIKSEILVANVIFEAIFYRFYEDEVSIGKIVRQEEEKIFLEDGMAILYEVNAMDLFENCEFETIGEHGRWMWNYKENHLPFQTGESVRFKIKKRNDEHSIEASMNEQGLGPVKWWD